MSTQPQAGDRRSCPATRSTDHQQLGPVVVRFFTVATLLIAMSAGSASAYDFDWGPSLGVINTGSGSYSISGLGFTAPVEDQGQWGTCWDFSAVTALESKYMLTRNDTSYSMLLSQEQEPMLLGGTEGNFANGGWDSNVMNQAVHGGGIVRASQLPYTAYGGNYLPPAGDWPLPSGWQNQAVVATSWSTVSGSLGSATVAALQTALKTYGPGVIAIDAGTFFYTPNGSSSQDATGTYNVGIDHNVTVVGYHNATTADDAAIQAAGGYWIIKNSWGDWGNYGGYGFVPYNLITSMDFYTGPAYYTGALATATWQGSGGTWAAGGTNWTSSGSAYSWLNQETAAVFNASSNNKITISGPAIAHSLTFNSGATGYAFSGGSLTVTAGGITANESVTINSSVSIGAPQTWTTAAGKTLSVNGNVSTIISNLTIAGAGATTISGAIGDGSAMLGIGGELFENGPGTLTLTASNTYSNLTAINGGTLDLSGSGGAIALSAGIAVSGGTLLLDNSTANNPNRIGSAVPLSLQGGALSLLGNAAGTAQSVNSLLIQGGGNLVSVTASSSVTSLTAGSLARRPGGAALVCGSGLGTASSGSVAQILFSTAPPLSNSGTGTGIGILPYFYGDNSPTGSGTDLVTYGSNGLCLLTASEYSGTVAAGTNVKLSGSASVGASTSILALVLANSGTAPQLTISNTATLTLTSGAVLSTGGSNSSNGGNAISGGTLTFGDNAATSYEGIVQTAANLTIGSAITNNAGNAVTLTKNGPATLVLSGANKYSGGTFVSAGILAYSGSGNSLAGVMNVGAAPGSPGALVFQGPTVANFTAMGDGNFNVAYGSTVAIQPGASVTLAGDLKLGALASGSSGNLVQSGGTLTINDSSSGRPLTIGEYANETSTYTLSAGLLSVPNSITYAPYDGAAVVNISGGTANLKEILIGSSDDQATGGAIALSGSGALYLGAGGIVNGYGPATINLTGGTLGAYATWSSSVPMGLGNSPAIDTKGYGITLSGVLSGTGGLNKVDAGALTLSASNTYTGLTTVSGGTLQLGDGVSNIGAVATILLANGSTVAFANPAAQTYASGITGSGSLVASGPGTLTLAGTNTYSGATTVNGGLLVFNNAGSMPSGNIVTLNNGASLAATALYSPAGWLSSSVLAASSSGVLELVGSCSQNLNLQSPTNYASLSLGSSGNNTYGGTLTQSGTTYRLGGGGGTLTMTQPLASGNSLVVTGPGGVALASTAGVNLAALQMNTAGGPAALQLPAAAYSAGSLANSGTATASLVLGNAAAGTATTLTVGGNNSSSTFSGTIGDLAAVNPVAIGGIVKSGSGTLTLAAAQSYNGPTVISGGKINFAQYPIVSTTNLSVGGSPLPGSYGVTGNTLTITGAGGDFWGSTEQGYYVYTTVSSSANFDVAVHIASMSGGDASWAKAGIMARQDASSNNVNTVMNAETTGSKVSMQWNNASENQAGQGTSDGPNWLRLTYTASTGVFTGYESPSASLTAPTSGWTTEGSYTVSMTGSSFLLGIADTAHNTGLTDTAVFNYLGSLFPLGAGANVLPAATALSIAGGAALDLSGGSQQVVSLSDYALVSGGGSIINSSAGMASVLTVSLTGGSTSFSGMIQGGGTLGMMSLVVGGSGTQVLSGSNSYSGSTTINGGGLLLDFSQSAAPASNILPGSTTLALGGGSLGLKGSPGGTSAQTVGALTLNGGVSGVVLNANGASSLSLTTGSMAVSGAATLAVSTGTNTALAIGNTWSQGSGASLMIDLTSGTLTSSPATTNGLIGSWVTVKNSYGIGLGLVSGSNVVSALGGTLLPASTASNTANYWLGGGTSSQTVTASEAGNSLSISPGTAGQSLTINSGQTLGLAANVLSFDGSNYTYTINGPGQLGASASVLTLNTAGSHAMTIAAPISSGTGGLTVLGSGTAILTASNAFSGNTTVGSGATLQIACGIYSAAVSNGGLLAFNSSGSQTFSGAISGNGALDQLGGVTNLTGSNTYSGLTNIAAGTLKLGNAAALGNTAGANFSNGAALDLDGLSLASLNIAGSGAIVNSSTAAGWVTNLALTGNATIATANNVLMGSPTGSNGALNLAGFTLTKAGTGTLALNGLSMSGGGNIVVNQGALQLVCGYGSSYGDQESVSMTGTGTLTINAGGSLTTPNWSAGLTLTMPIVLSGGTISSSWPGPNGATIASPISLTANSTMDPGGGYGAVTFSGIVSGTGGLSISDPQTLTLSGSNTYTGLTKITGGTLEIGNPQALAGSTLNYGNYGGIVSFGSETSAVFGGLQGSQALPLSNAATAAVSLSVGNNNQNTTYSGTLSGSGSLAKIGSGMLTLSATNNSYSGGTTLAGGELSISSSNNLGAASSPVTFNGGILQIAGTAVASMGSYSANWSAFNGGFDIAAAANVFSVSSALGGTGSLCKLGAGALLLTGSNTYSGGTTISAGTLQVGNGGSGASIGGTSSVLDNGSLVFNHGDSLTFSSPVSGSGSLTQSGMGILTLLGTNTYTGVTTIAAGTLKLDFSQAGAPAANIINNTANASSLVLDGGLLAIQGNPGTANSQCFNGLTVNPGSSAIVLATAGTANPLCLSLGSINRSAGGTLDFTLPSGTLSAANGITTSNVNTNGILGGYATVAGTNWAVSGGTAGSITPYAAYTGGNLGGMASNNTLNVSPSGPQTAVTSADSFYTLDLTGSLGVSMSSSGLLQLAGGGLIGNTSGAISGGTLEGSASGDLIVITPQNLTIGSVIANNGGATGLTKAGSGTLTLAAGNTYTGVTTIGAGAVQLSGSGALGTGAVIDNGALVLDVSGPSTYGGIVSGSGGLTQSGAGVLALMGSNSYTGCTAINAGTLKLGTTASLPCGTSAAVNGVLDLSTFCATLGALTGAGTVNHSGTGSSTLTLGSGNANGDFSGTIENSGGTLALLKIGTGELILSGTDSYSGGTTVDAGALYVTDSAAIDSDTSLTIAAGGKFVFDPAASGGSGTMAGADAAVGVFVVAVPEPGTLVLLLAAFWSAAIYRRFSRRPAL